MTVIEKRLKRNRHGMGLLRRIRSEVADSMTVFLITAMPLLLLFVGWTIDFTKNASVRSEYMDIAQEAAQAAIREQNGNGSLLCGQRMSTESNDHVNSTQRYVIRGVDNARKFVANASHGISGAKPEVPSQSQALQLAVKSYLEKSGRATHSTSVYSKYNNGMSGATASANDGHFVSNMRSIIGNRTQQTQLDNNVANVKDGATFTSENPNNNDTFSITVWCTKGVGDKSNRTNTGSINGNKNTVGAAKKFNTLNMEIHDWSGNFMLGMFNKNWVAQKYTMAPRAVASWSQSAVS